MIRIGQGYDVHRFSDQDSTGNSYIKLGGISIPFEKTLLAHSDGDVLLHAICDSILGAVGQGDIGSNFPDTDNQYKNIDSKKLLEKVVTLISQKNYMVNNIDCTIVAQQPKMRPYIDQMRKSISDLLAVSVEYVSVKATTTEKLGFTGRSEGIACMAVVLLQENK